MMTLSNPLVYVRTALASWEERCKTLILPAYRVVQICYFSQVVQRKRRCDCNYY